jgi:hypothetical protein
MEEIPTWDDIEDIDGRLRGLATLLFLADKYS